MAERLLAGPVTALIGVVCLAQLLTWIPHYLTWPLWADHDVFATLARGWEAGLLPYRDLRCNQFPGAIYLFWVLGQLAGWGRSAPIYAFDTGAVIVLGLALLLWSKRLFGAVLPGLVGYLSFLSYYLALDYSHAAQRDWHSPCLAVLGILILQTWRAGTVAPALSAAATGLALAIRPHAALFLPAVAIQLLGEMRAGSNAGRLITWISSFTLTIIISFVPLLAAGVLPDFWAGVRLNYSAGQGRGLHAAALLASLLNQFEPFSYVVVPLAVCTIPKSDRGQRSAAMVWLAAFLFVLFYQPISPRYHSYLRIPLHLVFAVNLAVLTRLLLTAGRLPPTFKLLSVLLLLGLGCKTRPQFCMLRPSLRAATASIWGPATDTPPPGYRRGPVDTSAYYAWADYRGLLDYLRHIPSEHTRIANALKGDPAVVGPLGRLPAFPAEGIAWLRLVNPRDEARFARSLEDEPDSLVVWSPGEVGPDPSFKIDLIESVILRLYEPDIRFGRIEVWRRKGAPLHGGGAPSRPGGVDRRRRGV